MKKILTLKKILLLLAISNFFVLYAQEKKEVETVYRRSSLNIILLQNGEFLHKDLVMDAYHKAPFPDKYNDHRLKSDEFNQMDYLDPDAIKKAKETAKQNKKDNKQNKKNTTSVQKDSKKKDILSKMAIDNYFTQNKIANQMVAKWFDRKEDGTFDMDLIHDRGSYDASEMEAQIAKGSIRGLAMLKDAGEELIKNTFIVVNKMRFVKNEPIARAIKESAIAIANNLPSDLAKQIAIAAANATYLATKDGYSVWTTSYLYQLDWSDDIANAFYMDMWMDSTNIDPDRKILFDTTSIFKMKYLGYEKAKSLVLIGVGKELKDIIETATIRNIDKVYTKLQKSHDVFKTKTPIYSVNPIIAKIGLKEGLEPNDKYDVLEQVIDKKTGLTKYVTVATVKVDKKKIWDNRYYMGDEEKPKEAELKGTYFKGGGSKVMRGMLLRQVK